MAMPDDWVNAIFTKLSLVYGARFKSMYSGHEVEQVRADWAHELDGIGGESINYALHNLPTLHPPNVLQFRELCRQCRPAMRQALPPPRGARMSPAVKAKLQQCVERMRSAPRDHLAGARSLRDKERRGILLTRVQREFWRIALANEIRAEKLAEEENA